MISLKNFFIPTPANNYRAYLLSNLALALYVIALMLVNIFAGSIALNKAFALIDETRVVELHNQERVKRGLGVLKSNPILSASAKAKGEAMLAADCWSHYCPNGKSPWDFFKTEGYDYLYAGENLAEGFTSNDAMHNAWMNSKTHRENILKPQFTEIGIALVVGDFQGIKNNTIVVVHFGQPRATLDTLPNTNSEKPVITSPQNNTELNTTQPTITGRYSKDVMVELGSARSGRISPEGGIFTYKSQENLQPGEYQATALDYAQPEIKSDPITFKVIAAVNSSSDSVVAVTGAGQINILQLFSFGLVLFLCLLFIADFIIVKHTNLKYNLKIKTRSHLHLPSLLVLLLLSLMGNLRGVI